MKCCSGFSSLSVSFCPASSGGQFVLQFLVFLVFAVFGLFVDSEEAVELEHRSGDAEPENFAAVFASMSTVVWSKTAGLICEATKRCQISL